MYSLHFLGHFRMNMCVCGMYVVLFEYSCVYPVFVYAYVSVSTCEHSVRDMNMERQLERIGQNMNVYEYACTSSGLDYVLKCKGLCKWMTYAFCVTQIHSPFINAQTLAHKQTTSYLRPHVRWIAIRNSLWFPLNLL